MRTESQKRRRHPDPRQMNPAVETPDTSRSDAARAVAWIERSEIRERSCGFHRRSRVSLRSTRATKRTNGRKSKRKQNADRRGSPCFTFRRSAHPAQGALACRRSTPALPLGLAHPKVRPRTRFREASAQSGGGLPPAFAPVTASTSRAGHNAGGLMSEPPECGSDETSARGHRSRSPPAIVTGRRPFTKSERPALLVSAHAESSRIILAKRSV